MKEIIAITKALADGGRMRVLAALSERSEMCVCQIVEMLQLAPATVSKHMSILENAGLVQSRKAGRWVYYGLKEEQARAYLEPFLGNLSHTPEIQADRSRLMAILCCDPATLRRKWKIDSGLAAEDPFEGNIGGA